MLSRKLEKKNYLFSHSIGLGHARLHLDRQASIILSVDLSHCKNDGRTDERSQRQLPTQLENERKRADRSHQIPQKAVQVGRDELTHSGRVRAQARQHVSRFGQVKEAYVLLNQRGED